MATWSPCSHPTAGEGPEASSSTTSPIPRNPVLVNRVYEPQGRTRRFREAHSIGLGHVDGRELAALHTGVGVEIWDLSDVRDPHPIGEVDLPGVDFGDYFFVAWQIFWQGPYLYVAGSAAGIYVVDVRDPERPVLVDRGPGRPNPIPTGRLGGFRVGPIFAIGNLLVISSMDTRGGYSTLDLGDPANPVLLDTVSQGFERFYATCFAGGRIISSVRGPAARMTVHEVSAGGRIELVDDAIVIDEQLYCGTQDDQVFQGNEHDVVKIDTGEPGAYRILGSASLGRPDADHGQVTPMANLVFVGNDHGTGSALVVHDPEPDRTPPRVSDTSPADGAVLQPLTTRVGLSMTDAIELWSVNETTFAVRPEGGEVLPGRYTAQLGILNFAPDEPLEPATTYEVLVPAGGLTDWAGNATDEDVRFTFTTGTGRTAAGPDLDVAARWPLDETEGSVAADVSGNGRSGSLRGEAGWEDGALVLGGPLDTVQMLGPPLAVDGDLTVSLWVRTAETSTSGPNTPEAWRDGLWLVDHERIFEDRGFALTNHHGSVKAWINRDGGDPGVDDEGRRRLLASPRPHPRGLGSPPALDGRSPRGRLPVGCDGFGPARRGALPREQHRHRRVRLDPLPRPPDLRSLPGRVGDRGAPRRGPEPAPSGPRAGGARAGPPGRRAVVRGGGGAGGLDRRLDLRGRESPGHGGRGRPRPPRLRRAGSLRGHRHRDRTRRHRGRGVRHPDGPPPHPRVTADPLLDPRPRPRPRPRLGGEPRQRLGDRDRRHRALRPGGGPGPRPTPVRRRLRGTARSGWRSRSPRRSWSSTGRPAR